MTPAVPSIESILASAVELCSAAERRQFVEQACGGDAELQRRVEELIENHFRAGSFLESPAPDLSATARESAREGPGAVIGPYKLLQQIGEGGMGAVFMAEQAHPVQRRVALKIIKPGMDSRQVLARFEAERQALALMDHPHIAKVHDGGTTDTGRPYFVMELVKGVPITRYCDEHRLTPRERLELFLPVCQAVQHAHQKGIIHRDLKPSNVLVALYDSKAVPKVIDFGVAKATGFKLTDKTLFTEFGQVVGTLEYMSPEQAQLNQLDIDTRSDIYALGVLLYELLTGTTPLERKRLQGTALLEALRLIREEEPPRPSTRLGTTEELPAIAANRGLESNRLSELLRGELDWIVMKCLEKDRNRRYDTANGLARDLERYLADEPVLACPPSAGYRLRKFALRHKAAVTAAALTAAVLVLGLVASTALAVWAMNAEGLASTRLRAEEKERRRALEAERLGKHRLYQSKIAEARATRLSRQPGQRFDSLAALREAAQLARELGLGAKAVRDLRDEAIACFALADVRLVQPEWPGFPAGSSGSPAFDPDLERYARSDGKGTISVRRVADDHELARLHNPDQRPAAGLAFRLMFSPDGSLLAWADWWHQDPDSSTNFQLWDWRNGKVVFQPSFRVATVAFTPDGRHFALAQFDGTITLHASAGGKEVGRWNGGLGPPWLAFHPDGRQLAIVRDRKVQIHDPTTGKLLHRMEAGADLAGVIAWHPAGTLIAVGGSRGQVYLWDAATGRAHATLHGHDAGVESMAFAAGGAVLVSDSDDGTTRLWDPWAGEALLRLPGRTQAVSRDGRRLLIQTGTHLSHWELVCGREYRTLPRGKLSNLREAIHNTAFSPGGRWLLGSSSRGVWLWDMAAESQAVLLPLSRTIDAQFHPRRAELFTSGDAGLFRWQAQVRDGVLRIGPSARCLVGGPVQRISVDQEGRRLTVVAQRLGGGGRVIDLDHPGGKVLVLPHDNTIFTATSPDGKWIATGTQHGSGVKLWEARTGKEHRHLIPDERSASVTFSPDSRWVVIGTGTGLAVWDVVSGKPVREIRPGPRSSLRGAAFSPDGTLLAVTLRLSEVELIETATWQPVARLLGPDTSLLNLGPSAFSPDGSQLVVYTRAGDFRVWDLRRVRAQLRDLRLDWDLPAYPPPPHAGAKPMRVEVDVGEFQRHFQAREHLSRGYGHVRAQRWQQAVDEYARALELEPDYAMAANNFAWLLATCPQDEFRDAPRAVALAQRAVRLESHNGNYWNTLGVAHYRAGEWQSAQSALEKSMLHQGGNSLDWFFLAMTHWRLGDQGKAFLCYGQAVQWMAKNQPQDEELRRFRAEAEDLLTAKVKKN
jgi:serine/threonine protein kinase/WD40 repeat protein